MKGRGERSEELLPESNEEDATTVTSLAADIAEDLLSRPKAAFAFCGLSMGVLTMLETAMALTARTEKEEQDEQPRGGKCSKKRDLGRFFAVGRAPLWGSAGSITKGPAASKHDIAALLAERIAAGSAAGISPGIGGETEGEEEAESSDDKEEEEEVSTEGLNLASAEVMASPAWASHFLPLLKVSTSSVEVTVTCHAHSAPQTDLITTAQGRPGCRLPRRNATAAALCACRTFRSAFRSFRRAAAALLSRRRAAGSAGAVAWLSAGFCVSREKGGRYTPRRSCSTSCCRRPEGCRSWC